MSSITTKLTRLLGIRTPIVCPPMAGASGGTLAARVSNAGGFGFISAGYDSLEKFRSEITTARSICRIENDSPLPIGVGFLAWQLETNDSAAKLLSAALESNVKAIWLAFGNHLDRWVNKVHEHNQKVGTDRSTAIVVQVSSTDEALLAMNELYADIIVAQGIEAGGHGASYALPLLTLVPSILAVTPIDGPPILAAGGLATGAQVASLLTLGASGVVLGTRFLLSPESLYTDAQRKALLAADSTQSVRTMAFDHARNTLGWPHGIDGRGLLNDTVKDYEAGVSMDNIRSKFMEGAKAGDTSRMLVWAGSGVGLMNHIKPVEEIVEELHRECLAQLQASATLF